MPSPVLNEVAKQEIACQMLASGKTRTEIAKELQVSQPTISRFAAKNREKIETMMQSYIDAIHEHTLNQDLQEIAAAKDISSIIQVDLQNNMPMLPGDKTANRLAFLTYIEKKITDLKRSIGLLSSHNVAMAVQNMYIYNSHTNLISPAIMQVLGISRSEEHNTIDAEFYDST